VKRLEPILLALFLACWLVDLLVLLRVVRLAGSLPLTLYGLYSVAVAFGWLFGNIYVRRRRGLPPAVRRRLLILYFMGPPGFLYLLRYMTPLEFQQAAPFVPLYAFGVFAILFLVPVTMLKLPPLPGGKS
jgi:hypothetical protein